MLQLVADAWRRPLTWGYSEGIGSHRVCISSTKDPLTTTPADTETFPVWKTAPAVLERPMYSLAEAAHLLRMSESTLRWWLEGKDEYDPVLRTEPTGSTDVTWGEFVEARLLREYRKRRVSLPKLRAFISKLRSEMGIPYPLAHRQPFIGVGRRLLLEAQLSADLPYAFVYEPVSGQLQLDGKAKEFYDTLVFDQDGWAARIFPNGQSSPIMIDPDYGFGAPTVKGIRTENIAELVDAGDPVKSVTEMYGLTPDEVKWATSFEWSDAA